MSPSFHEIIATRQGVSTFTKGARSTALVMVLGAELISVLAPKYGNPVFSVCAIASLTAMAVVLVVSMRTPAVVVAATYLAVGASAVFFSSLAFDRPGADYPHHGVSFAMVALCLFCSANGGVRRAFCWCGAGFLVAELSLALAQLSQHVPIRFDGYSVAGFVFISMVLLLAWFSRERGPQTQPLLEQAARDELEFDLRHRIELSAAALLHDTILNNLAAIATSPPGNLSEGIKAQLARDLETLSGEEWLTPVPVEAQTGDDLWRKSPLHQAVVEGRSMGLTVEVTGDLKAVGDVSVETGHALGLAVKQCLANVARHSGSDWAEIALHGSSDELLVMVIDTGCGFIEREVGTDRLGLRTSVRQRITGVGGTVQVWSTPGRGTSVVIRVPLKNYSSLLAPVAEVAEADSVFRNRSVPRLTGMTGE